MKDIYKKEYDRYLSSSFTPSEDILEKALIHYLVNELGYIYRDDIKDERQLKSNFKRHFEHLNKDFVNENDFEKWWIEFNSGNILHRFLTLKSRWFQKKDKNGKIEKTFFYFDFENVDNNKFEIINQLWVKNKEGRSNRFDIVILINGIPSIHIELKKEGVDPEDSVRQINKYLDIEAISDFLRFTKIYISSNGNKTRYFVNNNSISNNIRNLPLIWKDINNKSLDGEFGLLKFAKEFFRKEFILDFLNNYFVIDKNSNSLKIFRPYQYYATNEIIKRINNKNLSNKEKSGYVWHATGSGKTLTSFKACEILSKKCSNVDLTIFLIDRNDLNTQTFNNFKSFSQDENLIKNATDTNNLVELLTDANSDRKIIITTIQKLNNALKNSNNKIKSISNKNVVFIVDEGHRSQIGEMRKNIERFFKNAINIAFTGTPIFDINSQDGKTTEAIFGKMIHKYNSYDAINDKNVLDFIFKFTESIKKESETTIRKYEDDLEDELLNIENIKIDHGKIQSTANYIWKHYNNLTRNKTFNAILACSSIPEAIEYYKTFNQDGRISCCIVYSVNKSDYSKKSEISENAKKFLIERIEELNKTWREAINENSLANSNDIFTKYKTQIQNDFANKKYDLLIVVSMLLTGYDSPITNTLFLDKQLRYQSLIQAISRTNRLHPGKESGNIVSFKVSKEEVDEAFKLYTNGGTNTPTLWKALTYEDVKPEFEKAIDNLLFHYPTIDLVANINLNNPDECIKFLSLFKRLLIAFNKIKPLVDFNWLDFKMNERMFNQYKEHFNSISKNSNETKIIYVWDDYEIIDLETVIVDANYLRNLFIRIRKFDTKEIPENIENFSFYKEIISKINETSKGNESSEYIKEFLKNKLIYTSGDFTKIVELWKKYMDEKINATLEASIANWKTTHKAINNLIQYFKIRRDLDQEYIRKQLPNYINNPLYDDDKFEFVGQTVRKILKLRELREINTF